MSAAFDAYRASYDGVVQQSIDFSGLPHSFFMEAKALLLDEILAERLPGRSDLSALDVGCGIGALHPWIAPRFARLCGTDVSADCLERARRDNPGVTYTVQEGEAGLPYDSGEFDLVLAVCVVHHVPPARWEAFASELRRVTRPGGLVCLIEHNPLNPLTRLAVARCEFDRDAVLIGARRAGGLLRSAGCREVAARHFALLPSLAGGVRRLERAVAGLPLGAQYACYGQA